MPIFVTIPKILQYLQTRLVLIEKIIKSKPKTVAIPRLIEEPRPNRFRPVPIEQEPKRNNRFIVILPPEFGIESYFIQKINRPKISFTQNKYEWANIELELFDVIGPSTTKAIYKIIDFCQEHKNLNVKENFLFSLSIQSLDPVGCVVEEWVIDIKEILNIDFGDCDYSNDDVQKIKILIKPYNCELVN